MSVVFNASNLYLSGLYDITVSPRLLLTNSSTFDATSSTSTVEAQEISGNGYSRATLTIASNSAQPDGSYKTIYNIATFTASGGSIVFDRAVLFADGQFIGWFQYGSTTIASGTTFPFRSISISRTDSGTLVNGLDGINAQAITTASFTQPAINSTVSIALTTSAPFPVLSYCYFTDGTNIGWYKVTAYVSPTSITIENLGLGGSAAAASTMASGGTIVPSGREGVVGAPGLGMRYAYSATTTAPPSSGELRGNNATIASVTSIFVHETDRNGGAISNILAAIGNGSIVMLADESDPNLYAYFTVTAQADNGAYRTLTVTYITGTTGTFSGNVSLMTGTNGTDGIAGFGLRFTYSSTTTSPAGAGELRFNNASPGSATAIYVDAEDRNNTDVSPIVAGLNAGSSLLVIDENDPSAWALYTLSSVTDNTTNLTLTVTAIGANGTFSGNVSLTFANKGNTGATGATGATGSVSSASGLTLTETTTPSTPSANNLTIFVDSTDGLLKQKNDAGTVSALIAPVDEIWVNAGMIKPGKVSGATEGSYDTTIATYDVLNFDQTTEQDGFFTIVFGQRWNAGTIKAKFYWTAKAGTGNCIWGIQAVSVSSATNLDQTFGTAQEVTQTLSAVDQLLISSATAAITIGNTPAVDDLIQFRVYRKAAAGGDTLSGTASLIGIEIQYTQVQTGVAW